MGDESKEGLLLCSFRALDLTDEKGFLCGKLLGDLGVDVIKVERPGGDPSRSIGPFYHDDPDPEKSLYWFAFNNNKRGITLDVESRDGREIFKKLVLTSDFVIESFPPGYMDGLGLGYSALRVVNRRIIVTSITPFGQTGPCKDYKASDLVANAASGHLLLAGDSDRPPVRISFDQSYAMAGLVATVGTMVAHYYRQSTGEGQQVDASLQASLMWSLQNWPGAFCLTRTNPRRHGSLRNLASNHNVLQQAIWPCKDGFILFVIYAGSVGAATQRALTGWMDSEGVASDFLKNRTWSVDEVANMTQQEVDQFTEVVSRFFSLRTKADLYSGALQRGVMLYPVSTTRDIVGDPQLAARNFWTDVEHPELGTRITRPGPFAKLGENPYRIRRRAPLIGEHNGEIYEDELKMSAKEVILLKQAGVI